MKATGIVRRIDDLGRVVIPKEIRRAQRIREGDPLEIFVGNDGEVVFKKYSPLKQLDQFAESYAQSIYKAAGCSVLICDRDKVIAVAGKPKKDYLERPVSQELLNQKELRAGSVFTDKSAPRFRPVEGMDIVAAVACPILCAGDTVGYVVVPAVDGWPEIGDAECKLAMTAAVFLGTQMED